MPLLGFILECLGVMCELYATLKMSHLSLRISCIIELLNFDILICCNKRKLMQYFAKRKLGLICQVGMFETQQPHGYESQMRVW